MSATLPPSIKFQPLVAGVPLPGGKVYFYAAGTTTPQAVYAADGTTPLTNPLILDANGATSFRLGSGLSYKIDLFDANDVHQVGWPEDNVQDLATLCVLASDLASTATGKGAALVGYKAPLTGTVARKLDEKGAETYSTKDWGAKGDATTDDYAALLSCVTNAPEGATVYVEGICKINTPLVITRRVSLVCRGADDAILLNVGSGNDGITYSGGAVIGLNAVDPVLNVYGAANCCRDAVVLDRVFRSDIKLRVHAGAVAYGVRVKGGLIDRVIVDISNNYDPPIAGMGLPLDHMLIEKETGFGVATNACEFWVNLEGCRHGIVGTAQSGEGNNWIHGTIEGLSGRPFDFTTQTGITLSNLHIESNGQAAKLTDCRMPRIGPEVIQLGGADPAIELASCGDPVIDGYYGGTIRYTDESNYGGQLRDVFGTMPNENGSSSSNGYGFSAESLTPSFGLIDATVAYGGPGRYELSNIYPNCWMDLWENGSSAAPAGVTLTNCTVAKAWSTPDPCPGTMGVYAEFTTTAAASTNGPHFYVPQMPAEPQTLSKWNVARYVAITMPVYIATGQPAVNVYINGKKIATVTVKDKWVWVRGAALVAANTELDIWCTTTTDGTTFTTGTFAVGGLNICNGAMAPKFLASHGRREAYVYGNVSNAPAFLGQHAYVSGTGKWYLAKGSASSADWILLN